MSKNRSFDQYLKLIATFKKKYGHTEVPENWVKDPKLGCYVRYLRQENQEGRLSKERKKALKKVGFSFERTGSQLLVFQKNMILFERYLKKHGKSKIFVNRMPKQLKNFLLSMEKKRQAGELSGFELKALKKQGFPENIVRIDKRFLVAIEAVVKFHQLHGHFDVSRDDTQFPGLYYKVSRIRARHKKGELSKDELDVLESNNCLKLLDIQASQTFRKEIRRLQSFYSQHKHLEVPRAEFNLYQLVRRIRIRGQNGALSKNEIALLDALYFPW